MIAVGDKTIEFRDFTPHWKARLIKDRYRDYHPDILIGLGQFVEYDEVHFRNGYNPKDPFMRVETYGTLVDFVKDPGARTFGWRFLIRLGDVLDIRNWEGVK
jgi:hypothetical protein